LLPFISEEQQHKIFLFFHCPIDGGHTTYLNDRETRFMWHYAHSLFVGWAMTLALFMTTIAVSTSMSYNSTSMAPALSGLAGIILSFVIPRRVAKPIHKFMIKKTRANEELIDEFADGLYLDKIPAKYRNIEDCTAIILILSDAQAHNAIPASPAMPLRSN